MKKFMTKFEISILPSTFAIFLGCLLVATLSERSSAFIERKVGGTPMHSIQLTQKGYIQFLRWELPVPDIHEFTFCLWMKSNDLKHPHSIFSYSRNEQERLIRSWISSRGKSVHLEISGVEVFRWPVHIREDRWYHICQSWENRVGRYALWLDGRLELQGRLEEMIDYVIPGSGDIVLGQEYTDFNKGLEEGIEGSVLGFNLLLASVFNSLESGYQRPPFRPINKADGPAELSLAAEIRVRRNSNLRTARALDRLVSKQFALNPNWSNKIFRGDGAKAKMESSPVTHLSSIHEINIMNDTRKEETSPAIRRRAIVLHGIYDSSGEIDLSGKSSHVPLGLQLVKLSYVRCQLGRGSPPIESPLMLISWSRTPVRVFGGAIIKNVGDKCGKF